ncbi:MAG: Transketolase 2 [Myxococcota bacterium]|nr:Transketolase 2 [Myxococcota bacterium]
MLRIPLTQETLNSRDLEELAATRRRCAQWIIECTTLAGSGHPGGSLSSLDFLMLIYAMANHDPANPRRMDRDRIVISHGHVSPGVYAVLADAGYFDPTRMVVEFRRAGALFSGHVESVVPGVEWSTGNLGQGLSAGCGMALASRLRGGGARAIVCMGDGEQQKGQIGEARRFAVKYGLHNLCAVVDVNGLQIGGETSKIMPQDIAANWRGDGWNVIETDGHDLPELHRALRRALTVPAGSAPTAVLARTVMGKGVPFMENKAKFHGSAASHEQAAEAFAHLGVENRLAKLAEQRKQHKPSPREHHYFEAPAAVLNPGTPRDYDASASTDCRSAYGAALDDLARLNNLPGVPPRVIGFSCDLQGSVKMDAFEKTSPAAFYEAGIQEHHTAVCAGALSREGHAVFFSTFGVFAIAESYNQQRLNAINGARLKVCMTHVGLDVGEDGPTHQNIDYVGLASGMLDFHLFVPADPNQTDRAVRHMASSSRPEILAMGRSKVPVLTRENGAAAYAGDWRFVPGQADVLREGRDVAIIAMGCMVCRALEAWKLLRGKGIHARVINMASVIPLDRGAVLAAARETRAIITYEDHNIHTGLGALTANALAEAGISTRFLKMGVTRFGSSGVPDELFAEQGLSPADLANAAIKLLG